MIPIKDTIPSRSTPVVNFSLIGVNAAVFLYELHQTPVQLENMVFNAGFIPADFFACLRLGAIWDAFWPIFTSMFMHGGWTHFIGNIIFLYIFGDNVEDRLGHARYLVFYLACGVAAAITQAYITPYSTVPMIGASGAISGVLGAYFLLFPHAQVITLIPIFFFFDIVVLPAFVFLGLWVFLQLIQGTFALAVTQAAGGVAWWAHIGGFAAGMLLVHPLKKRKVRPWYPDEWWPW